MFRVIALIVAFFVSFSFADIPAPNLIQNGSFELPGVTGNAGNGRERVNAPSTEITGWTVGGTGDIFVHQTPFDAGPNFNPAQDGSFYIDLSGDGAPHAFIYQDFATVLDSQYALAFYIGAAADVPSSTVNVKLTGASLLLNTDLTPLPPGADGINWLNETFSFTADSTTTRLSFVDISGSDDNASFIDSVSVVPEPTALSVFALIALALRRRR